jgi:hypothetical protein
MMYAPFQELMMLIEAGLLTTQNALMMSNMIMGLDFKHAGAVVTTKYKESEQYMTPAIRQQIMAQKVKIDNLQS